MKVQPHIFVQLSNSKKLAFKLLCTQDDKLNKVILWYECMECGNAGCPSFDEQPEIPEEVIIHMQQHAGVNH